MTLVKLNHVTKRFGPVGEPIKWDASAVLTKRNSEVAQSYRYMLEMDKPVEAPDRDRALDDVTLAILNGEALSVIGPSGCGKSTLLRVIAGLIDPDEGEILYDGRPLHQIPLEDRGIGMVFQSYALFPHLESRENIGFWDYIRKHEERIPERIRYISDEMNIPVKHLLSRRPPQLSGGERQRVALARALARDPKLFLFDEPLSNLDAKLRASLRVQLKRVIQKYQITSVYVTHDQAEAIALGDRIAVMNRGRIEQVGTYHTLYETPANMFVAGFLGSPSMNFFEGTVEGHEWHGEGIHVGPFTPASLEAKAVLGIRPEHVEIANDGTPVIVERVDNLYDHRYQILHLRMGPRTLTATAPLPSSIEAGNAIYIHILAERSILFDADTGQRLKV